MNIKELKKAIKDLPDDLSVGLSVKKVLGKTPKAIIYVSDEDKVTTGEYDGMFWIDGEYK